MIFTPSKERFNLFLSKVNDLNIIPRKDLKVYFIKEKDVNV